MGHLLSTPSAGSAKESRGGRSIEGDEMVQDPECHVYVPVDRAVSRNVGGEKVYFCSEECAKKYVKGIDK